MNKLQELTDRLYEEGLSKGKAEGEHILEEARKQAAQIVEEARKQAAEILSQAKKDAEDYKSKVTSDVKMASSQSLQTTKKEIENLIIASIGGKEVKKQLSSAEFIKNIIKEFAVKFSS